MMADRDARAMVESARQPPVDYATLGENLAALGYGSRLELLDILRFPRSLTEIRLSPARVGPGENPDRAASKQTVHAHLEKLVDADLVRVEQVERDGRSSNRYVVNRPRLYAITEELRRLNVLHATGDGAADDTGTLQGVAASAPRRGPRLVLVHGVYEGKAYALDAATAVDGRWVVGRRNGAAVRLDYDPFVSLDNSFVTRDGDAFHVHDIPGSKNGTHVNWTPLAPGASRILEPGDAVGVGRSLLTFAPH